LTSPVPGLTYPNPRTWSPGDLISVPRLRGDMYNLAALFTTGRPLFLGTDFTGETIAPDGATALQLSVQYVNTWGVVLSPSSGAAPIQTTVPVPFAGWYLADGNVSQEPGTGTASNAKYAMGFTTVQNGAGAVSFDGSSVTCITGGTPPDGIGGSGADLYQLNPATGDTIQLYAFNSNTGGAVIFIANLLLQWVALPTSGLTNYTGPDGTVVRNPAVAANFPAGPGTTVTAPVSAGATSVTVSDATGMITGGTLGLDYTDGLLNTPAAEAVTITSVAGTTIGISAARYPHSSGAPVAVPVSAAFLNQQCRDVINFLAYPPICRLVTTSTQSIASTGFPPTPGGNPSNQISTFGVATVDNFGAAASGKQYTIPVAGLYYIYGQVYYAGSSSPFAYSAGISVNGGTIQWGDRPRASTTGGAVSLCAVVRHHIRCSVGDVISLWAYQGSGSAMNTVATGADVSRMIILWRSF
jgi:hypothetical protein